jgi:hypothetical protein
MTRTPSGIKIIKVRPLELALRSNAASLERSRRAAVAAPSGLAADSTAMTFSPAVAAGAAPAVVGVAAAKEAAVLTAALLAGVGVTAACMPAAGTAASGVGSARLAAMPT